MQKINARGLFIRSGLLIWSILCVLVFIYFPAKTSSISGSTFENWPFILSKLARIEPINFIANLLWALVGVVIFSAVCISVGWFLLLPFKILKDMRNSTKLSRVALLGTAFSLGQGLLSVVLFALARFNQLTSTHVVIVLVIGFIIGLYPISKSFIQSQMKYALIPFDKSDRGVDRAIIWLNLSILALSIMYSTSRLSYDSVALYFSSAKITAITNHIQFYSKFFIVSSFQTGIQYAALIQIFGDQAARLYSWINGVMIIIFTIALGEKAGLSKRSNLILMTLILTSTAFLDLMGDGKIELASTVPAIATIYWMIANNKFSKNTYILTGILAGLAMISRPYDIVLLAMVVGLYYLFSAYYTQSEKGNWIYDGFVKPIFWISIGIICLLSYHLAANWMVLGDPMAFIKTYEKINWSQWQWALNPDQIWKFRLLYPFVVTYLNTPQTLGNITPLFIGFLPALLVFCLGKIINISRNLTLLVYATLITLFAWLMLVNTIFEIRYVLFLWLILFLPISITIEQILNGADPFFQVTTKTILVLLLVLVSFRVVYISIDTYSPIDKHGNPQCYDFPFCTFLKPINELASMGDRVLALNAYRYYLRQDLFACSTNFDEYTTLETLSNGDSTRFWTEVYREGYKFIAYESNYSVWHLTLGLIPNPDNTPTWLTLKPIYGEPGDQEVAYQILAKDPPVNIEFTCQKSLSGVWEVRQITK